MGKKYDSLTIFEFQGQFPIMTVAKTIWPKWNGPMGLNVKDVDIAGIVPASWPMPVNAQSVNIKLPQQVAHFSIK